GKELQFIHTVGPLPHDQRESPNLTTPSLKVSPSRRHLHSSCLLHRQLIVFGGYDVPADTSSKQQHLLMCDPQKLYALNVDTQRWRRIEVIPSTRYFEPSGAGSELMGASIAEPGLSHTLDVSSESEEEPREASDGGGAPVPLGPLARIGHTCVPHPVNSRGTMVLFGGYTASGRYSNELCTFQVAPGQGKGSWASLATPAKVPVGRCGHSANVYRNSMFVFGGFDGRRCLNDLWRYDFSARGWRCLVEGPGGPTPRFGHTAVLHGDQMFVLGGRSPEGRDLNDLWCYDLISHSWEHLSPQAIATSEGVFSAKAIALDGKAYVFGGVETDRKTSFTIRILDLLQRGRPTYDNDVHSPLLDPQVKPPPKSRARSGKPAQVPAPPSRKSAHKVSSPESGSQPKVSLEGTQVIAPPPRSNSRDKKRNQPSTHDARGTFNFEEGKFAPISGMVASPDGPVASPMAKANSNPLPKLGNPAPSPLDPTQLVVPPKALRRAPTTKSPLSKRETGERNPTPAKLEGPKSRGRASASPDPELRAAKPTEVEEERAPLLSKPKAPKSRVTSPPAAADPKPTQLAEKVRPLLNPAEGGGPNDSQRVKEATRAKRPPRGTKFNPGFEEQSDSPPPPEGQAPGFINEAPVNKTKPELPTPSTGNPAADSGLRIAPRTKGSFELARSNEAASPGPSKPKEPRGWLSDDEILEGFSFGGLMSPQKIPYAPQPDAVGDLSQICQLVDQLPGLILNDLACAYEGYERCLSDVAYLKARLALVATHQPGKLESIHDARIKGLEAQLLDATSEIAHLRQDRETYRKLIATGNVKMGRLEADFKAFAELQAQTLVLKHEMEAQAELNHLKDENRQLAQDVERLQAKTHAHSLEAFTLKAQMKVSEARQTALEKALEHANASEQAASERAAIAEKLVEQITRQDMEGEAPAQDQHFKALWQAARKQINLARNLSNPLAVASEEVMAELDHTHMALQNSTNAIHDLVEQVETLASQLEAHSAAKSSMRGSETFDWYVRLVERQQEFHDKIGLLHTQALQQRSYSHTLEQSITVCEARWRQLLKVNQEVVRRNKAVLSTISNLTNGQFTAVGMSALAIPIVPSSLSSKLSDDEVLTKLQIHLATDESTIASLGSAAAIRRRIASLRAASLERDRRVIHTGQASTPLGSKSFGHASPTIVSDAPMYASPFAHAAFDPSIPSDIHPGPANHPAPIPPSTATFPSLQALAELDNRLNGYP
ncbi:hypothetical protein L0F63_007530, partial [Massospora cicadina]